MIAYSSRGLKSSEHNYLAHKLEFWALKWSMTDKFHDYLFGRQFQLVTDNNPHTYVTTSARLDATGHRWLAAVSAYEFSLLHHPGKRSGNTDSLSRWPHPSSGDAILLAGNWMLILSFVYFFPAVPRRKSSFTKDVAQSQSINIVKKVLDDAVDDDFVNAADLEHSSAVKLVADACKAVLTSLSIAVYAQQLAILYCPLVSFELTTRTMKFVPG